MQQNSNIRGIEPVLPSADIERDLLWYKKKTGFTRAFGDLICMLEWSETNCVFTCNGMPIPLKIRHWEFL